MGGKNTKKSKEPSHTDREGHGADDSHIPESGDSRIPESADRRIPESDDSRIPESADRGIPESDDSRIPESADRGIPESDDSRIPESDDSRIPEFCDSWFLDSDSDDSQTQTYTNIHWRLESLPRELALALLRNDGAATAEYLATHTLPDDVEWHCVLSWVYETDDSTEIRPILAGYSQVPLVLLLLNATAYNDMDTVRMCLDRLHDDPHWLDVVYQCCTEDPYPHAFVELIATESPLYTLELGRAVVSGDLDTKHLAEYLLIIAHKSGHEHLVTGLLQAGLVTVFVVFKLMMVLDNRFYDLVEIVLRQCQDVNVRGENEMTPLHYAVCNMWDDHYVRLLLSLGADLDPQDAAGHTPLHLACNREWRDEIEALFNRRMTEKAVERVEGRDKMIKQAWCVGGVMMEDVRSLLEAGAKADVADVNGQTPLHGLCSQNRHMIIRQQCEACCLLMEHGAQMNKQDAIGMTPVAYAAVNRNCKLISELIRRHADVNLVDNYGQSPLIHCVQNSYVNRGKSSHIEAAQALLNHPSININWADLTGNTALSLAVGGNDMEMVKLLLQHGADLKVKNKDGETAAHRVKDLDMVKLLVEHGVNLNAQNGQGSTILHLTAHSTNLEVLTYLLQFDCKVNKRDNLGSTALDIAVATAARHMSGLPDGHSLVSKFKKVITILLEKGTDIEIKDNHGESALMTAITEPSLLKMLMEKGAKKDTRNSMGSGLYHAIIESHPKNHILPAKTKEIVKLLQENDLDINMQDMWERNALHVTLSSEESRADIAQIFLDHGCDVAVRDSFDYLPIYYAIKDKDMFQKLWNLSLPHLSERDFNDLRILAHWKGVSLSCLSQEKKTIAGHLTEEPSMVQNKPQDFTRPTTQVCSKHVSLWYEKYKNLLPDECIKLQSFTDFHQQWLHTLQPLTYQDHQLIVTTLKAFVQKALAAVGNIDPIVACEFRLSGSESEMTKIIHTNEMDALSVFTFITFNKFYPPSGPCHPVLKEFVKLECRPEYREELAGVLDEHYCLSRSKLYERYSTALSQALADPLLWKEFPNLQRITNRDIVASNRTIAPMKVRWHDDVYPYLLVDVDMVPALDIIGWWPQWASTHPLLMKHEALVVPKWKPTAVEDDCMMEVGISHWSQAFDEMPQEMQQGYRLAKAMKEICPNIINDNDHTVGTFLTSYMLKMIIVRLYANAYYDSPADTQRPKKDARQWALEIYHTLEKALEKQKLSSFFIEDYNLLYDPKFAENRELAISYTQLCQIMLTREAAHHFSVAYLGLAPEHASSK